METSYTVIIRLWWVSSALLKILRCHNPDRSCSERNASSGTRVRQSIPASSNTDCRMIQSGKPDPNALSMMGTDQWGTNKTWLNDNGLMYKDIIKVVNSVWPDGAIFEKSLHQTCIVRKVA